jgi:hypothetical protein
MGLLSNRTTGTTLASVLGKCGNENRMHWILHSTRSVRLSGEDLRLCMQNASECQDAVTTRQDHGQTCRDVFVNVKPSYVSCRSATSDVAQEAASTSAGLGRSAHAASDPSRSSGSGPAGEDGHICVSPRNRLRQRATLYPLLSLAG